MMNRSQYWKKPRRSQSQRSQSKRRVPIPYKQHWWISSQVNLVKSVKYRINERNRQRRVNRARSESRWRRHWTRVTPSASSSCPSWIRASRSSRDRKSNRRRRAVSSPGNSISIPSFLNQWSSSSCSFCHFSTSHAGASTSLRKAPLSLIPVDLNQMVSIVIKSSFTMVKRPMSRMLAFRLRNFQNFIQNRKRPSTYSATWLFSISQYWGYFWRKWRKLHGFDHLP